VSKAALEKQVEDTSACVTEWKRALANIEQQFQAANLARATAKKRREANALKASMADPGAVAAVKQERGEQQAAEQTIEDLKVALPEAQAQLATAEKTPASARHELAMFHAQLLMRKRIEVAARIDAAIAEFSAAFKEFEKLGREIEAVPDLLARNLHGVMSQVEEVAGLRRVAAALPGYFTKFFPGALHDERPKTPLAASETTLWGLHDEKNSKAA